MTTQLVVLCSVLTVIVVGCATSPKVTQTDFDRMPFSAITMSFPKSSDKGNNLGALEVTMAQGKVKATTKLNYANFDIIGKKPDDIFATIKLITEAAGTMDLSKTENVPPFEQRLRALFAIHHEVANAHVRMNGNILSVH